MKTKHSNRKENRHKHNKKARLVIFISGRGSNMEKIIAETKNGILKDKAEIMLVFSDNPSAPGLKKAMEAGIPVKSLSPKRLTRKEYFRKVREILQDFPFDFLILAGFMRILSPEFVREYKGKIINIHPADTRLHRGLGAYEWAWNNRLEKTYITIHYVDEGVDTGEIIAQAEVDLEGAGSLEEVEKRGLETEHRLYPQTILELIKEKMHRNK